MNEKTGGFVPFLSKDAAMALGGVVWFDALWAMDERWQRYCKEEVIDPEQFDPEFFDQDTLVMWLIGCFEARVRMIFEAKHGREVNSQGDANIVWLMEHLDWGKRGVGRSPANTLVT